MSSIATAPFDFRARRLTAVSFPFRHQLVAEFPLTCDTPGDDKKLLEAHSSLGWGPDVHAVFPTEAVVTGDPRPFTKLLLYACAIRRGDLPRFIEETGLPVAGPTAAVIAHEAKLDLPWGTVFPAHVCAGELIAGRTWIVPMSTRFRDVRQVRLQSLWHSANVNYIACVE